MNRWQQLTKREVLGMTVNERLYLAGLLDDFDKAAKQKNTAKLRSLLEKVHLSPENIDAIIKNELSRN
jgi:hypothetical protein